MSNGMGRKFLSLVGTLRKDELGVTLVEYGVALVLVVSLGAAAFTTLANEIGTSMSTVGSAMP